MLLSWRSPCQRVPRSPKRAPSESQACPAESRKSSVDSREKCRGVPGQSRRVSGGPERWDDSWQEWPLVGMQCTRCNLFYVNWICPADQGVPQVSLMTGNRKNKHTQALASLRAGRNLHISFSSFFVSKTFTVFITPLGRADSTHVLDVDFSPSVLDQAQKMFPILDHVRIFCIAALGWLTHPLLHDLKLPYGAVPNFQVLVCIYPHHFLLEPLVLCHNV